MTNVISAQEFATSIRLGLQNAMEPFTQRVENALGAQTTAVQQLPAQFPQPIPPVEPLATEQSLQDLIARQGEITQELASVGKLMNPYYGKTPDEIRAEYKKLGLEAYSGLIDTDLNRAITKLNMVREIDGYADDIYNYNASSPSYIDEGFQRKAFDIFVKTEKKSARGVPTKQTYKYIPKSIPEANIHFDGKLYNLIQGGTRIAMKNYRDIERLALLGGVYSEEMKMFRLIRQKIEHRDTAQNIIFKARKW